MDRKCVVVHCKKKIDTNRVLHKFPSDKGVRNTWISVLNLNSKNFKERYVVCSDHFTKQDYFLGSKRLKRTAVPSLDLKVASDSASISAPNRLKPRIFRNITNTNKTPSVATKSKPSVKSVIGLTGNNVVDISRYAQGGVKFRFPELIMSARKTTLVSNGSGKPTIKASGGKNCQLARINIGSAGQKQKSSEGAEMIGGLSAAASAVKTKTAFKAPGGPQQTLHITEVTEGSSAAATAIESLQFSTASTSSSSKIASSHQNANSGMGSHVLKTVDVTEAKENIASDIGAEGSLEDLLEQWEDVCVLAEKEPDTAVNAEEISSELQNISVEVESSKSLQETSTKVLNEAKKSKVLNLMEFIKKDEDLIAFTGVDFQLLNSITELFAEFEGEVEAKKFTNSLRDRIAMCLCKLRINISFRCLAVMFGLSRQQCVANFEYVIVTLSVLLEKAIYWPTKEEILDNMPKYFQNFKKTRVVLDCTEIPVERFKCLNCRLKLYSHYYGCETLKILLGVAPSGLISFLSQTYGGRTSDKTITEHSKILDKLDPFFDAVMVDKGFMIEEECLSRYIEMIRPPFLRKNKQLDPREAAKNKEIARARIHVERTIQRFKMFKIVTSKVNYNLLCYFDCITKVVAALVNLKNPLLADENFL